MQGRVRLLLPQEQALEAASSCWGWPGNKVGRNSIWDRWVVCVPPPVFPGLSRLCCCWCGAVPSTVICPGVLWCQAVAGTPSGPRSKAETSVPLLSSSTVLVAWLFPHSARGCSESGIPVAIISSNGIPVSRNPLTVNEDFGPFLSPSSSALTAGCCLFNKPLGVFIRVYPSFLPSM